MLWSKNLKNKSYMTLLVPSFQYVDNLFPWFAPEINGFVRATLAIKRDTRRTEPVFNRHRPGSFGPKISTTQKWEKNDVSSINRFVMFRCQTGMSCKHPGKGDHFKVVEMFVPNKASFPIDDFVFCERKCFQHQRLILLIVGAGGINLGSVQSWNGHSQVQSYY